MISKSAVDIGRQGNEIYDRLLRRQLEPVENGKFVAIDIDSSEWEVDADDYAATQRLVERIPGALIWLARIGSSATYRIGGARIGSGVND
jgi:hypothetical protein